MDLRHLELLRELADRGTITAVAEATFRSPSAVSQQLHTAERAFGVPLVEPDGRRLRLTRAGQVLAAGAVGVAVTLAQVQRDLDALQDEPAGAVSVAALPSAAEYLVPPLLMGRADSPIRIEVADEDVSEADFATRAADHDIVIGHSLTDVPPWADRVAVEVLVREPLDVALPVGHRLAGRVGLTAADLGGEDWIGVPLGFPFDTVRIAIENRSGAALNVVQRLRDNRLVEALVAAGLGCAMLPRFTTRPRPDLVTIPLTDVRSERSILALGRPDRFARAAVRAVLDDLHAIGAAQR
ncbi:LysR family transcriptional regulator [Propionicicella superfundia]|uniref:LysR family transcriptional regulator n=1 Tax=Propionicicella superfundia TaxID=348582 RepID=UPI000416BEA5|nr:LysR family transcriptional regulator [Propionicicella superfundia]